MVVFSCPQLNLCFWLNGFRTEKKSTCAHTHRQPRTLRTSRWIASWALQSSGRPKGRPQVPQAHFPWYFKTASPSALMTGKYSGGKSSTAWHTSWIEPLARTAVGGGPRVAKRSISSGFWPDCSISGSIGNGSRSRSWPSVWLWLMTAKRMRVRPHSGVI